MDAGQISTLRRFNRTVTRRLGALDESFHDRGRPLAECRLLFEIGEAGADLRTLRRRLGLDSGYLSRMIRRLSEQGLVRLRPSAADRRVRVAVLTTAGRAEWQLLDERSDAFARATLDPLTANQRRRLVGAMAEAERLMRAAAVTVAPEPPDSPAARFCLDAYFAELSRRFETGFDPARSLPADQADLAPPRGVFLLASLDGEPVGCAALRARPDGVGEVKRMWVGDDVRGLGLGRRLLEGLEAHAVNFGLTRLRLETNRTLTEAQALYRRCGFREVPAFNDETYAHHWFEKDLGDSG